MSLTDRIQAAERAQAESSSAPIVYVKSDVLEELKANAVQSLYSRIGARINDSNLSEEQLRGFVRTELAAILEERSVNLTAEERRGLTAEIEADALGLGPIQRLLDDDSVTEIMVNHSNQFYVVLG